MNILYLCDEYPPGRHGGIGTATQILAREMVKRGHNVVVAGFYDWGYGLADEQDDMGVRVYRFRKKLNSSFFAQRDSIRVRIAYRLLRKARIFEWDIRNSIKAYGAFLEGIITRHKIDIVEMPDFNEYMHFCSSEVYFPKLSVPTIVKLHGSIPYILREAGKEVPAQIYNMQRHILTQANAVVSVSKYAAGKTATYLDYHSPIIALYNGIELMPVPGVEKIPNRVIFTGTLLEIKGIYQLMKAWNKVQQQISGAELLVFGKGDTRKVKAELTSEVLGSVHFKGHISRVDIFKELAKSSVAVFPSFVETFGLAAAEAMLCGTAVINTRNASGPEIVEDGVSGLLVDPADVDNIADSIIYLLSNEDVRKELSINGRKRIEELFSISKVAERHEIYYKVVIESK